MPTKIRTVCGDIEPSAVKLALTHEHLVFQRTRRRQLARRYFEMAEPLLERDLANLLATGCNTLVDVTPKGCGREPAFQRKMSQQAGIHIVACTGAYVEPAIPPWVQGRSVDWLSRQMQAEIEQGIEGTDIRAGIIKVASSKLDLQPMESRFFRAAVAVHKRTGVAITCHSYPGIASQVRFFQRAGIDPSRVALGHIEVTSWFAVRDALKAGFMLCYTNFGSTHIIPEDVSVAQVAALVKQGYASQLMLSVDFIYIADHGKLRPHFPVQYDHIQRGIVPKLLAAGVDESQLDTILNVNPRRFLAF